MSARAKDALLTVALRISALTSGSIVLFIVGFLIWQSWAGLHQIGFRGFFQDASWHPLEGKFNLVPMIAASFLVMLGAMALALPLGLASAVFCQFYAPPKIAWSYRRVLELLAGVPSVVYGFWGLVVLVPLIRQISADTPGASLLTGILILAVMVLPTVALLTEAALVNVPSHYLRNAAALSMGRWAALRLVVLPAARGGIATAGLLAAGRAVGETMALLMVCGNVVQMPSSVLDPVRTLTANIALEMGYAFGAHRSALFVTGLVLLTMVIGLVILAEWVGGGRFRQKDATP